MNKTFKIFTDTLANYSTGSLILPIATIHMVILSEDASGNALTWGMKYGDGRLFAETPWVTDPRTLSNYIPKFTGDNPRSNYFLAEDGNYYKSTGYSWEDLEKDRESNNKYWLEPDQKEFLDNLMYQAPTIGSFTTSATRSYDISAVMTGDITFNFSVTNQDNIASLVVSTSKGNWEGAGDVTPSAGTFKLKANNITFGEADSTVVTLTLTDTKGNVSTRTISFSWIYRMYFGCSSAKGGISDPTTLIGAGSLRQNSRQATITFTPSGQQYSALFIPQGINQSGIDIRNSNAASISHSYNMNLGDGGTVAYEQIQYNGLTFNVYYSYNTTNASSTAIIQ